MNSDIFILNFKIPLMNDKKMLYEQNGKERSSASPDFSIYFQKECPANLISLN